MYTLCIMCAFIYRHNIIFYIFIIYEIGENIINRYVYISPCRIIIIILHHTDYLPTVLGVMMHSTVFYLYKYYII